MKFSSIKKIRELIPLALVITPDIPEAEVLTGMRIATKDNMKKAAVKIHRLGAKNVVVKGGHLEGEVMDLLFDGKSSRTARSSDT